jgi:hypothetical protein
MFRLLEDMYLKEVVDQSNLHDAQNGKDNFRFTHSELVFLDMTLIMTHNRYPTV